MRIEILVPRLGWSMEEGAFVAWLKRDGEFVRAGEPIFSIEGDKAVQEIESIDSGILRIAANGPKPGDSVRVGDVLGHLVSAAEEAPQIAPATAAKAGPGSAASDAGSELKPVTPQIGVPPLPVPLPRSERGRGGPRGGNGDGPEGQRAVGLDEFSPATSVPTVPVARATGTPAISPRAWRVAAELGVDWTAIRGSGRSGRIRERDIRSAAVSGRTPGSVTHPSPTPVAPGKEPTVLVTGGCGFIGTWVVRELLQRGLRVVVLDAGERPARWERVIGPGSRDLPLVRGSLLDRELLTRVFAAHPIAHVIHLAALLTPACQVDPWEGCRVNVLASVALFEQIRALADPIQGFSYASSVAVFGDEPDHAGGPAKDASEPRTFYGVFKKSLELIAGQYWQQFQIASLGIRPQVAYGPERDVGLTAGPSLAARAVARGESFSINYTGCVGYDYVEDVARALVRGTLETPPGAHVVDLSGEVADVGTVIAAIAATAPGSAARVSANGPRIPGHAPPRPRFISTLYPDWQTTSLAEGIRRTVEFYRGPQAGQLV